MERIYRYIAADKPSAAQKLMESIYEKVTLLTELPELGYRLLTYKKMDIRVLLYGHYRILYQIEKNGNIHVLGVFHGALDLKKHLKIH